MLDNDLLPYIGNRPIEELETWELLQVLNRVSAKGAIESAHRCRQLLNQICRYAKQTGRSKHNPASDLVGALPSRKVQHRAAITDPTQFAQLLVDIDAYSGTHITRTLLALVPLLFQRPAELAAMEWSEIDLDAAQGIIPKAKKKERNQREGDYIVPCPAKHCYFLLTFGLLTGHFQYVFTDQCDRSKHANPESVNKALRGMGYNTSSQQC